MIVQVDPAEQLLLTVSSVRIRLGVATHAACGSRRSLEADLASCILASMLQLEEAIPVNLKPALPRHTNCRLTRLQPGDLWGLWSWTQVPLNQEICCTTAYSSHSLEKQMEVCRFLIGKYFLLSVSSSYSIIIISVLNWSRTNVVPHLNKDETFLHLMREMEACLERVDGEYLMETSGKMFFL